MSVKDAVALRFKNLCRERGMSTNELANISGVTPSTAYSMLDSRRRDISVVTVKNYGIVGEHRAMVEAIKAKDKEEASKLVAQHLNHYHVDEKEIKSRRPEFFKV